MRFLKRQTINRRQLKDPTVYSDVADANVYINPRNSGSMVLPSGTDAQIPASPINGMMRYNADHDEVQVYQSNTWRSLRFKESTTITQQNLGAGDSAEVYFGPLNPAPPTIVESGTTWGAQNILVVVENVLQLSGQNYTVVQNPTIGAETYTGNLSSSAASGATVLYVNSALTCTAGSGSGTTVTLSFSSRVAPPFSVGSSIIVTGFTPAGYNGTYTVTACTNNTVSYLNSTTASVTVVGSATSGNAIYPSANFANASVTGTNIHSPSTISSFTTDADTDALVSVTLNHTTDGIVASATTITITESSTTGTGYYLKFSSPVPYGKIVTVLHGFDK